MGLVRLDDGELRQGALLEGEKIDLFTGAGGNSDTDFVIAIE